MTEKIIRRLSEITEVESQLETQEGSCIAAYPEKAEIKEHFCDGGSLVSVLVKMKLKGTEPDKLFKTAENACRKADSAPEDTAVYRTAVPPELCECTEAGLYMVSCVISADYIKEAEDEDSI